ncbi:MAG: TetR/AcrR family transcriptional regulator, partial [Devosiaceae bacterium]|nr:TetR/AcrR family transcriptional regulator [Devosiaceae bacterium MH13]
MAKPSISGAGTQGGAPAGDDTQGKPARYHHGNLREALLSAAEAILIEADISALTLRSVAARAGVSHAAPTHHFGSLRGLLTALAASGMNRFADALEAGQAKGQAACAYVEFARDNRALFLLMFDIARLDYADPAFKAASLRASDVLGAISTSLLPDDASEEDHTAMRLCVWARAHGYTMLMLTGQLSKYPVGDDHMGMLDMVLGKLSASDLTRR